MSILPSDRARVCGQRYSQRRRCGKIGWADEDSYTRKQGIVQSILTGGHLPKRCRVLELGCGNGCVTLSTARKGHDAYGVDIVPEAIDWAEQQAREQGIEAHFTVGSVITLSAYTDAFFDFVFDADCLFMIIGEDRKPCVENVFRVLKPGGIFYATAHLVNEKIKTRALLSGKDYFDPKGRYSTVEGIPMYYFSRAREFKALIEGAGFKILRHQTEPKPAAGAGLAFYAGDMWIEALRPGEICQPSGSATAAQARRR